MTPADIIQAHGFCDDCHYDHYNMEGTPHVRFLPCPRLLKALEPPKPSREGLEVLLKEIGVQEWYQILGDRTAEESGSPTASAYPSELSRNISWESWGRHRKLERWCS